MDISLALSFIFGLGILSPILGIVYAHRDAGRSLAAACVLALIFLLPGALADKFSWSREIFFYFVILSFLFGVMAKEYVLPKLSEHILLAFNLIFIYAIVNVLPTDPLESKILITLISIPTILVMASSFFIKQLNKFWQVIFFNWYLLMSIFLVLLKFPLGDLQFLDPLEKDLSLLIWPSVFMTGATTFYLINNWFYLLEILPIPGKRQRFSDRIAQWKEHVDILDKKFLPNNLQLTESFLIILIFGGVFALNYFFNFISPSLLINLGIVFSYPMVSWMHKYQLKIMFK